MKEFYSKDTPVFYQWIKDQWGIEFDSLCPDADIQGSPERSIARAVFKDKHGRRFLIEAFHKKKYDLRKTVAAAVDYLNRNGLSTALAYKKTVDGVFLPFFNNQCYQISDYLDSTGVKQPDYLGSAVMGESFGHFMVALSKASKGIESCINSTPFSIKPYIYELFDQMLIHDPDVYELYRPVLDYLEKHFMDVQDQLPTAFCHGDLHPLNVIWDHDICRSVIDWEFTGFKPDIYDLANLVGCAGIEDPNGFGMPMVMRCIHHVKAQGIFSDNGWQYFPEYLLALRFAWLSEWLRKKDRQMIEMERAYMGIVMDNMDVLRLGWKI